MSKKIVLASNNAGKLAEFAMMFADFNVNFVSQADLGVSDVEETGLSFVENAILKARHGCKHTNLPCIADDSGLEVLALEGKPGIYSARYAGLKASDDENIDHLLAECEQLPNNKKQAQFRCVMVYMHHSADPAPIIAEGLFKGLIINQRIGEHGFGYDPVFYISTLKKTCAQLMPEQKNAISHRAKATQRLIKKLIANKRIKP